ncbi:hypothetical protein [Anaerovibrio sp.]|uniref:hypothetical protein n=1 Tax=Anaerovibrio sp. TaxID=1872532 RepID=UPI00388D256C
MASKVMNFKMDETEIMDMKKVAAIFNISVSDMIREAIKEHIGKLKKDPFYRLTVNVEDATPEENEEILAAIDSLAEDDLEIVSSKEFHVQEA